MPTAEQWQENHPGVIANLLKGCVSMMLMATAAPAARLRT